MVAVPHRKRRGWRGRKAPLSEGAGYWWLAPAVTVHREEDAWARLLEVAQTAQCASKGAVRVGAELT
ncbi:hypothetical protein NDU88_001528 [Pleurodeles waltl]|uniref:Uncharacterized protein n=1 Tax=Pleurodeles waltl TaxID=8319 RepID=A0AAV7LYW4_PLEWA|nr:hypothetical protein NDU88_001528 [Pleurodeles waltl]